ncbi:hypothetical protein KI387_002654, partial [Taxus chinensis]
MHSQIVQNWTLELVSSLRSFCNSSLADKIVIQTEVNHAALVLAVNTVRSLLASSAGDFKQAVQCDLQNENGKHLFQIAPFLVVACIWIKQAFIVHCVLGTVLTLLYLDSAPDGADSACSAQFFLNDTSVIFFWIFVLEIFSDLEQVAWILENSDKDEGIGLHAIVENDIFPSIIACLADGDNGVATAATDAVKNLARSTRGLELLSPSKEGVIMHLKQLAMNSPSLVRIRILAIASALFGISSEMAAAVHQSGLLGMFEQELNSTSDMLATLNVLEVLYELAATPYGAKYLLTKNMLQRLASTISDISVDSMLRSRAMIISARLLSLDSVYSAVDELDVKNVIQAIDMDLELLKSTESNEREIGLNGLGLIGTVTSGAELLLCNAPPTARHAIDAAFSYQWRNVQMAGTHALAAISGVERTHSTVLLNDQAESCLRNLIYTAAENSSKRSPSGLFWSLLQQDAEVRIAAYRLIAGLVTRPWCLWEVCSKQEIINFVTDPYSETVKEGMEFRHSCCVAINNSLMASDYKNDAAFSQVAEK